ncbi:MAG: chorismate synthase [Clostridiales bacterium]|jgi:chorismate synthase|nr:chorismate synthase [Clostridiales bacterium]
MNTFGESIKLTIFGESHGEAIGMVLDGFPAGENIDIDEIKEQLARRAPGKSEMSTPRKEADEPVFLSGLFNGHSTGAPICAIIRNTDKRSEDYHPEKPRPGHADLTAQIKYKGCSDFRGGGPFSGRLTAAMVLAGAVCKQALSRRNISVDASIIRIGPVESSDPDFDFAMRKEILDARASGDSIGGAIECSASGVPAGLGGLMFGGMESRIAAALYAIPGVKGVEFGAGFEIAKMRGSQANDPIRLEDGRIYTETNNSGGINGGITNGMPLVVRCAFRPTPSIGREQKTVDLLKHENTSLRVVGRHDPCIVPRAVPVVESMIAFCLMDVICGA